MSADFCSAVESALQRGEPQAISDGELRAVFTAAVKLYAAKVEREKSDMDPFDPDSVTATETVVAVCAMIRSANINLFDLAMWYRRPLPGFLEAGA